MSYARVLEDGCYIYPNIEKGGLQIDFFPLEELDFIPDSILDVILAKMSDKEINDRRKHGNYIRSLLIEEKYTTLKKDKDFFEWRDKK